MITRIALAWVATDLAWHVYRLFRKEQEFQTKALFQKSRTPAGGITFKINGRTITASTTWHGAGGNGGSIGSYSGGGTYSMGGNGSTGGGKTS